MRPQPQQKMLMPPILAFGWAQRCFLTMVRWLPDAMLKTFLMGLRFAPNVRPWSGPSQNQQHSAEL